MPNHVTNILTIEGGSDEAIQHVVNSLKTVDDEGHVKHFDFNKVIPMPESLNLVSGSCGEFAYKILRRFGADPCNLNERIEKHRTMELLKMEVQYINTDEEAEEAYNLGVQYLQNQYKYGHTTWYDWCIDVWGTKWNAYDVEVNDNTIKFDTAWSASLKITLALSRMFPGLTFTHLWADEDFGNNLGRCVFTGEECVEKYTPESCSKEAYELGFEVRPDYKNWYDFDGETYQYNDEKCEEWYENN